MGAAFVPGTRRTHLIQKLNLFWRYYYLIIVLYQSVTETHRPTICHNKNAAENYWSVFSKAFLLGSLCRWGSVHLTFDTRNTLYLAVTVCVCEHLLPSSLSQELIYILISLHCWQGKLTVYEVQMWLCVCVCVSPSVCLSVCLCVFVSVCLSVCLLVRESKCMYT